MEVILASAGTGKTHALLEIFQEHVPKDLPPYRVALVTFSRWTARELLSRVEGRGLPYPFVGTSHGFLRVLLTLAAPWTERPVPEPVDEFEAELVFLEEAKSLLLEEGLEGVDVEDLRYLFRKRAYAWPFSPKDEEAKTLLSLFERVLGRYKSRMGRRMGPSDLELEALDLLRDQGTAQRFSERFPLVLVDEYQDTSPLQARLFKALEGGGSKVVAVGDSKQSIYAFRNADVEAFRQAVKEGEVLKRLDVSHRHPEALVEFLNALTRKLFKEEHFPVKALRKGGRVEVHWVVGEGDREDLRAEEARLLARRLRKANEEGMRFSDMAVLVRSRASLLHLEEAFQRAGVPYVQVRGRGFFQRPEVRAVYRALSYAAKGAAEDLFPLLIGPYFGLTVQEAEEVLEGKRALPELQDLLGLAQLPPLEALRRVMKTPAFRGRLDGRARQNLDALLALAGVRNFQNLEALLLWLARGVEDPEAGEVPEGGEAVQLMTIHAAKGLQFPLVALFDLSRGERTEKLPLYVGRDGGVARRDEALKEEERRRREDEAKRLLYVALSRAKEVLLVTGSFRGKLTPWGKALSDLGYGPEGKRAFIHRLDFSQAPRRAKTPVRKEKPSPLEEAPYTGKVFKPPDRPFLHAPSRALAEPASPDASRREHQEEWLPLEASEVPAWPRAVGILTHWAIAQNLHPTSPEVPAALLNQEVALPFQEEGEALLEEVLGLLQNYYELIEEGKIPPLRRRDEDHAELPLLLQEGETTWVGVADRVYRVGEVWYLEDYKTDQEPPRGRLEGYRLQLEVYRKALEAAWGVRPRVRLVFLRSKEVAELRPDGWAFF